MRACSLLRGNKFRNIRKFFETLVLTYHTARFSDTGPKCEGMKTCNIQGIHKTMVRYQKLFTFDTAPLFCVCPVFNRKKQDKNKEQHLFFGETSLAQLCLRQRLWPRHNIFKRFHKIAKNVSLSVWLSAWNNLAPTGRIIMKFDA